MSTDHEFRDWVIWHRTREQPIRDLGVAGGDLARTCGGGAGAHPSSAKVTVDVMRVTMDDGEPTWGVAHVVARRSWLRDELVFVMNAEFYGPYDVAPRSHPNDGKVDVLRVDAIDGLARPPAGPSKGPHREPYSAQSAVAAIRQRDRSQLRSIDGRVDRRCSLRCRDQLTVIVEPDAFTAYV